MPTLTASNHAQGPIVQMGVMVSNPRRQALIAANLPIPAPILIRGLIDTGASCTCVDHAIISHLGITPTGSVPIMTPSTGTTPHHCEQYDVSIAVVLGNNDFKIVDTLPVLASSLGHHGIEALIGRDILSLGVLIFNGPHNTITLCF